MNTRRAESRPGLLALSWLLACSPRAPEAATPAAASAEPAAAATPAEPPPPAPSPAVADRPGLELGAAELAAVDAACKKTCERQPCKCDATRPLPDFLLTHLFDGDSHAWYVSQRKPAGYVLLTNSYEHSDDGHWTQSTDPDRVCYVPRVGTAPLSADTGVVRVEHRDLNLDGRDDLLLECRSAGGDDRYLRYCLSSEQWCAEPLVLREVRDGVVLADVDVEFRDGWFVRTIRANGMGSIRGNVRVQGVTTPDPRP